MNNPYIILINKKAKKKRHFRFFISPNTWVKNESTYVYATTGRKQTMLNKGNNRITELRAILQRESQNS